MEGADAAYNPEVGHLPEATAVEEQVEEDLQSGSVHKDSDEEKMCIHAPSEKKAPSQGSIRLLQASA